MSPFLLMGFEANNSEYSYTPEKILEKITDLQIFQRYCSNFRKLGIPFKSDLRKDPSPSCKIGFPHGSKLLNYRDFSTGESYNCFSYLRAKWPHLTFPEVLRVIDTDFNLQLGKVNISKVEMQVIVENESSKKHRNQQAKKRKRRSVIVPTFREWSSMDRIYWNKYKITTAELEFFGIRPISMFHIDKKPKLCAELTYHYAIQDNCKIYAPLADKQMKWRSNTTAINIQGYDQLPDSGSILIITSSLKDVVVLNKMRYPAIAFVSEHSMPTPQLIENLYRRFDRIAILLDNDYDKPINPGQQAAEQMQYIFYETNNSFPVNIVLPEEYECKDPSDFVEKHGYPELRSLLQTTLDYDEDNKAPF